MGENQKTLKKWKNNICKPLFHIILYFEHQETQNNNNFFDKYSCF